jgi:SAM-dependent methyltransferase
MFQLAKCTDLIKLKSKGEIITADYHSFGLKHMGYLFVREYFWKYFQNDSYSNQNNLNNDNKTEKSKPRVLEVGAGAGITAYAMFENTAEYWIADKPGFYDKEKFEKAQQIRTKAILIPSFMGEFSKDIPSNYFDIIFSVSVIEHIPINELFDSVSDMYRILKPGGFMLHSLDLRRRQIKFAKKFKKCISKNKFKWCQKVKKINFKEDGLLYEPVKIVHDFYTKSPQLEAKLKVVSKRTGTVLIAAQKLHN